MSDDISIQLADELGVVISVDIPFALVCTEVLGRDVVRVFFRLDQIDAIHKFAHKKAEKPDEG
jgi:hypothetical protein